MGIKIGFHILILVWDLFMWAKKYVPIFVYGTGVFLLIEIVAVYNLQVNKDETLINMFLCGEYGLFEEAIYEAEGKSNDNNVTVRTYSQKQLTNASTNKSELENVLFLFGLPLVACVLIVPVFVIVIIILCLTIPCLYALILQTVLFIPLFPIMRKINNRKKQEYEEAARLRLMQMAEQNDNNNTAYNYNLLNRSSIQIEGNRQANIRESEKILIANNQVINHHATIYPHVREMKSNYQSTIDKVKKQNVQYLAVAYKIKRTQGENDKLLKAIKRCEEVMIDFNEAFTKNQSIIWYSKTDEDVETAYADLKSEILKVRYANEDLLKLMKEFCK